MFQTVLSVLFVGLIGIFLGIFMGGVLSDLAFQNGLQVISKAFLRITKKKWLRSRNPDIDINRIQRDQLFIVLPDKEKIGTTDVKTIEMVTELKQRLIVLFGNQIEALYLFGSRARGDYQLDSDVDVGIFLTEIGCSDLLKQEILYQTSELLLKYGLFIQTRIFDQNPSHNDNVLSEPKNYLAQIVVSYGIRI